MELRLGIAALGGFTIPFRRLDHVRCRGLPDLVQTGEPVHRRNMAPSCRLAEQCLCADRAAWLTAILQHEQREMVLRARVASRRGLGEPIGSL